MRVGVDGKVRLHTWHALPDGRRQPLEIELNAGALIPHFQLAFVIKDQKAVQHF